MEGAVSGAFVDEIDERASMLTLSLSASTECQSRPPRWRRKSRCHADGQARLAQQRGWLEVCQSIVLRVVYEDVRLITATDRAALLRPMVEYPAALNPPRAGIVMPRSSRGT
jgi:hypothetical protein